MREILAARVLRMHQRETAAADGEDLFQRLTLEGGERFRLIHGKPRARVFPQQREAEKVRTARSLFHLSGVFARTRCLHPIVSDAGRELGNRQPVLTVGERKRLLGVEIPLMWFEDVFLSNRPPKALPTSPRGRRPTSFPPAKS